MMTVYIPKHEGGRGMIQLELSYKTWTIIKTNTLQH